MYLLRESQGKLKSAERLLKSCQLVKQQLTFELKNAKAQLDELKINGADARKEVGVLRKELDILKNVSEGMDYEWDRLRRRLMKHKRRLMKHEARWNRSEASTREHLSTVEAQRDFESSRVIALQSEVQCGSAREQVLRAEVQSQNGKIAELEHQVRHLQVCSPIFDRRITRLIEWCHF